MLFRLYGLLMDVFSVSCGLSRGYVFCFQKDDGSSWFDLRNSLIGGFGSVFLQTKSLEGPDVL